MIKLKKRIYVTGHRNPDIDSIASAYALAELRNRQNLGEVIPLCPGKMPERAAFLFQKFNIVPPQQCTDLAPKIRDIALPFEPLGGNTTLFEAVKTLRESGNAQLPVVKSDGAYAGMLSAVTLLSQLLNIGSNDGNDLAGRSVTTSIDLISNVLEAEILVGHETSAIEKFEVYVAAMAFESFEEQIPRDTHNLAVIVGDRPDIHLRALDRSTRLLIVTGSRPVEPLILREAGVRHVTILRSPLDSASIIRRLKFAAPLDCIDFPGDTLILSPDDRIRDCRARILNSNSDLLPVVNKKGKLTGVVTKKALSDIDPYSVILVDHNELDQSLPGVDEIPVIEVVDHHRLGMMSTAYPIKFTADVVGSTCTLVASMFRAAGESLTPELAGLLLGGIVSDTLLLKSPTATAIDRRMLEWLEKISGVKGEDLMMEMLRIDSPLATKPAAEVINGDRKDYSDSGYTFAVAQVEETNLELVTQRKNELLEAMQKEVEENKLDFFTLLATDAVRVTSLLLFVGNKDIAKALPYEPIAENLFDLPGVLSRKKQLLPQILSSLGAVPAE